MRISVIGTGYVGLVTGVGLATKGHIIMGVDAQGDIVERIAKGNSPIHENGLETQLQSALRKKTFSITTDLSRAISETELTFICVGTPSKPDGSIDLRAVRNVAEQIGNALKQKKDFHTVVVKSTVLPGTTRDMVGKIIAEKSGKQIGSEFGLVMNPEFLREGNAVKDFLDPDRIVIGSEDGHSYEQVMKVYGWADAPILQVNIATAEMIKYTNNAFLALCISFSNEIAQLCERIGTIDAVEVLDALAQDGRITTKAGKRRMTPGIASYLFPGCGFGGSCFFKDLSALKQFARSKGCNAALVQATLAINEAQVDGVVAKAEKILGTIKGKPIAILGTAFKPDTDDIRESPAIKIISALLERGATIHAYDPTALENTQKVFGNRIAYSTSSKDALKGTELAIVITAWEEFRRIEPGQFKQGMKRPAVLDCRRLYDKNRYSRALEYYGTGLSL